MGESKSQSSNKEWLGCAGVIGAALVAGIFAVMVALLTRPTPAPIIVIVTETPIVCFRYYKREPLACTLTIEKGTT